MSFRRAVLTLLAAFLLTSPTLVSPALAFYHGVVSAPPPDSFANGIYFPANVTINPDVTAGTPLLNGFVRGLGPSITWTAPNVGGGSAYGTIVGSANYATLNVASALAAAAPGVYQVTVTANDGVLAPYTQTVTITKLAASNNVALAGGNVLKATSNPAIAPNGPTIKVYATPTYATTGDPQLPSNLFSTYMRFFGNATMQLGGQAWIDQVPTATGPLFIVGFVQTQAAQSNGALAWYGNNSRRNAGQIVQTLSYVSGGVNPPAVFGYQFEWVSPDNSFLLTAFGGPSYTVPGSANANFVLGVWQAVAVILNPDVNNNLTFWVDGVFAVNQGAGSAGSWPVAIGPDVLGIGLGSFGSRSAGASSSDNHSCSCAYRNYAVVTGIPTGPELEAFRNGGNPQTIWPGGRVWSMWAMTTDVRTSGLAIPDTTGLGHPLTVADLGAQAGHAAPYLVTDGVPYIADGYGPGGNNLFRLVDIGGGAYRIETVPGVTPSDYYGVYTNVLIITGNGYEFTTTLYINDGQ